MKSLILAGSALALSGACLATSTSAVGSGGTLTHHQHNRDAFALPAPTLDAAQLRVFSFGNRLFNTVWTVAPASAEGFDGLGPVFNRNSCSGCHLRDGRGRPPIAGEEQLLSMLVRISMPGNDRHGAPREVPGYGDQINDRAIPGVPVEARVSIEWTEIAGTYADGHPYSLRKPLIKISNPAFGKLPRRMRTSARVAPAVFGLGLLEAIDQADLHAAADPLDRNRDGISGRINQLYNPITGQIEIGRFGWKANSATLAQQNAAAALGDIGLTSSHFTQQNCPPVQSACVAAPTGGDPELSDLFMERLTQYIQMLGVPSSRQRDAQAQAGAQHFANFGCAACHTPQQRTARDVQPAFLADQTFMPYTDLLLHDMGAGLADGRKDFLATAREWRTAPLWGVGLIETTNGHNLLLHDGRARGLAEAILWHGGEARAAAENFRTADARQRAELLAFLGTL